MLIKDLASTDCPVWIDRLSYDIADRGTDALRKLNKVYKSAACTVVLVDPRTTVLLDELHHIVTEDCNFKATLFTSIR